MFTAYTVFPPGNSSVTNRLEALGLRHTGFLCTEQPPGSFSGVGHSQRIHQSSNSLQNEGVWTLKDVRQLNYYVVLRL